MSFNSFIEAVSRKANHLSDKATDLFNDIVDVFDNNHVKDTSIRHKIAGACDSISAYSKFLSDVAMHVDVSDDQKFIKTLCHVMHKHDPGRGALHDGFVLTEEILHVFEN